MHLRSFDVCFLCVLVAAALRSSRVPSAAVRSGCGSLRAKSASYQRTVALPRCLTAGASDLATRCREQNNDVKKIQRPKTVKIDLVLSDALHLFCSVLFSV